MTPIYRSSSGRTAGMSGRSSRGRQRNGGVHPGSRQPAIRMRDHEHHREGAAEGGQAGTGWTAGPATATALQRYVRSQRAPTVSDRRPPLSGRQKRTNDRDASVYAKAHRGRRRRRRESKSARCRRGRHRHRRVESAPRQDGGLAQPCAHRQARKGSQQTRGPSQLAARADASALNAERSQSSCAPGCPSDWAGRALM